MTINPVSFSPPGTGIAAAGLTVRWPSAAEPLLEETGLQLDPGEVIGLGGRSGSGKSTLLHLLSGLVPWHRQAVVGGSIRLHGESIAELDPGQRAHLLATCLDRPDAQLFLPTPRHELEAARRLYGGDGPIEAAIELFSLASLLDQPTTELSSGQRQRVALAGVLAACPRPVLLDEPTAHLDQTAVAALTQLLSEVRRRGGAVLLSEQAGWRLATAVTSWLQVIGRGLAPRRAPQEPSLPRPPVPHQEQPVLRARDLAVARGERTLLAGIDLELRRGEVVLLSGSNGSGKSTLALALAGLRRQQTGVVEAAGRVALMLPVAELQLFAATVLEELRTAGAAPAEMARVLRRHRLEEQAARAPWTLSRGERQRLLHAACDLLQPAVMIIDEPGQGLDPHDLARLVDLLHRRAERGRAYLLISHRQELAAAAHRHLQVSDGTLVEAPR